MRLLTENDVKKLVMRTCLSADRLSEKWGSHLMDLTKAAASHLSPEDENIVDLFNSDPETQGALARVQNALLNPHLGSNAGLIVSSDRQKRPLLLSLAHQAAHATSPLRFKKIVLVDFLKIFADPDREKIVFEMMAIDSNNQPGVIRDAGQSGDTVLVFDWGLLLIANSL
jgi:hypothetical protein